MKVKTPSGFLARTVVDLLNHLGGRHDQKGVTTNQLVKWSVANWPHGLRYVAITKYATTS